MLYISKGFLTNEIDGQCWVMHSGTEHRLTHTESELWLAGRATNDETDNLLTLDDMEYMGLIRIAEDDNDDGLFKLLCDCMFIPVWNPKTNEAMTSAESILYTWLREAGINLTTAELICLCEEGIAPVAELLGDDGRQALISQIYLDGDINEITLETKMASSDSRTWVLSGLLSLVEKNYLYIG